VNIKALTITQARNIYKRDYWDPLHLTEFEGQWIATETFDTAVNCGKTTAANMHLRLINAFGPAHYLLNGKINSEQVEWINKFTRKKINRITYYKALNVLQGERYLVIIEHKPKMIKYVNSWYMRVGQ
jgi:lysozyme family protein